VDHRHAARDGSDIDIRAGFRPVDGDESDLLSRSVGRSAIFTGEMKQF